MASLYEKLLSYGSQPRTQTDSDAGGLYEKLLNYESGSTRLLPPQFDYKASSHRRLLSRGEQVLPQEMQDSNFLRYGSAGGSYGLPGVTTEGEVGSYMLPGMLGRSMQMLSAYAQQEHPNAEVMKGDKRLAREPATKEEYSKLLEQAKSGPISGRVWKAGQDLVDYTEKTLAEKYPELELNKEGTKGRLIEDFMMSIPAMASIIAVSAVPGIGASAAGMGGLAASAIAGALSGPIEALMEASEQIDSALKSGSSEAEAFAQADEVFGKNVLGLTLSNMLQYALVSKPVMAMFKRIPGGKNLLSVGYKALRNKGATASTARKAMTGLNRAANVGTMGAKMLLESTSENIEERFQNAAQAQAAGDSRSMWELMGTPEAEYAGKLGSLGGALFGGAGVITDIASQGQQRQAEAEDRRLGMYSEDTIDRVKRALLAGGADTLYRNMLLSADYESVKSGNSVTSIQMEMLSKQLDGNERKTAAEYAKRLKNIERAVEEGGETATWHSKVRDRANEFFLKKAQRSIKATDEVLSLLRGEDMQPVGDIVQETPEVGVVPSNEKETPMLPMEGVEQQPAASRVSERKQEVENVSREAETEALPFEDVGPRKRTTDLEARRRLFGLLGENQREALHALAEKHRQYEAMQKLGRYDPRVARMFGDRGNVVAGEFADLTHRVNMPSVRDVKATAKEAWERAKPLPVGTEVIIPETDKLGYIERYTNDGQMLVSTFSPGDTTTTTEVVHLSDLRQATVGDNITFRDEKGGIVDAVVQGVVDNDYVVKVNRRSGSDDGKTRPALIRIPKEVARFKREGDFEGFGKPRTPVQDLLNNPNTRTIEFQGEDFATERGLVIEERDDDYVVVRRPESEAEEMSSASVFTVPKSNVLSVSEPQKPKVSPTKDRATPITDDEIDESAAAEVEEVEVSSMLDALEDPFTALLYADAKKGKERNLIFGTKDGKRGSFQVHLGKLKERARTLQRRHTKMATPEEAIEAAETIALYAPDFHRSGFLTVGEKERAVIKRQPMSSYSGNKKGGAAALYSDLIPVGQEYATVIDAFGGSGLSLSVFNSLLDRVGRASVYNELDKNIFNVQRQIKENPDGLIVEWKALMSEMEKPLLLWENAKTEADIKFAKEEADRLFKMFNHRLDGESADPLKRAAWAIYANDGRLSRVSDYSVTNRGMFNADQRVISSSKRADEPYQTNMTVERMREIEQEISGNIAQLSKVNANTRLSNARGENALDGARAGDLVILDPPYYNTSVNYREMAGHTSVQDAVDFVRNHVAPAAARGVHIVYTNTYGPEIVAELRKAGLHTKMVMVKSTGVQRPEVVGYNTAGAYGDASEITPQAAETPEAGVGASEATSTPQGPPIAESRGVEPVAEPVEVERVEEEPEAQPQTTPEQTEQPAIIEPERSAEPTDLDAEIMEAEREFSEGYEADVRNEQEITEMLDEMEPYVRVGMVKMSAANREKLIKQLKAYGKILSNAYGSTEALKATGLYHGEFPIYGDGLIGCMNSKRYKTDNDYRKKVSALENKLASDMISNSRETFGAMFGYHDVGEVPDVLELKQSVSLKPLNDGSFRAGLGGGSVLNAWKHEAGQTYQVSSGRKGDIGIREAVQNALDAVLLGMERGETKSGNVTVWLDASGKYYQVDDNGVGMNKDDILNKFLQLYESGKRDNTTSYGRFGVGKAIILMCTESDAEHSHFRVHTQDYLFDESVVPKSFNPGEDFKGGIVRKVKPRRGTSIAVWDDEASFFTLDCLRYLMSLGLPEGVSLTINYMNYDASKEVTAANTVFTAKDKGDVQARYVVKGQPNLFKPNKHIKRREFSITVDADTKITGWIEDIVRDNRINKRVAAFGDKVSPYGIGLPTQPGRVTYRIYDPNVGLYLTQFVDTPIYGFHGVAFVDVETTTKPGTQDYPFTANRMSIRPHIRDIIVQEIESKMVKDSATDLATRIERPSSDLFKQSVIREFARDKKIQAALNDVVSAVTAGLDDALERTDPGDAYTFKLITDIQNGNASTVEGTRADLYSDNILHPSDMAIFGLTERPRTKPLTVNHLKLQSALNGLIRLVAVEASGIAYRAGDTFLEEQIIANPVSWIEQAKLKESRAEALHSGDGGLFFEANIPSLAHIDTPEGLRQAFMDRLGVMAHEMAHNHSSKHADDTFVDAHCYYSAACGAVVEKYPAFFKAVDRLFGVSEEIPATAEILNSEPEIFEPTEEEMKDVEIGYYPNEFPSGRLFDYAGRPTSEVPVGASANKRASAKRHVVGGDTGVRLGDKDIERGGRAGGDNLPVSSVAGTGQGLADTADAAEWTDRHPLDGDRGTEARTSPQQNLQDDVGGDTVGGQTTGEKAQFSLNPSELTNPLPDMEIVIERIKDSVIDINDESVQMPESTRVALKSLKYPGIKFFSTDSYSLNGMYLNGEVYINVQSEKAMGWLVGHETAHLLQEFDPQAYEDLVGALDISEEDIDSRIAKLPYPSGRTMDANDLRRMAIAEIVADMVGDSGVADKMLWRKMQTDNPNLFQKVLEYIRKAIQKIMDYFSPPTGEALQERLVAEWYQSKMQDYLAQSFGEIGGVKIEPRPVFYSRLLDVLSKNSQKKWKPEQLEGWLRKQPVTAEEIVWSGIQNLISEAKANSEMVTKEDLMRAAESHGIDAYIVKPSYEEYTSSGGSNYREITLYAKLPGMDISGFPTGDLVGIGQHFQPIGARTDVQSILVGHVRLTDRVDSEGRKVLFVEEMQSDLANARGDLEQSYPYTEGTKWLDLQAGYIVRYAAEYGYDAIAWTPGQMQRERYLKDKAGTFKNINVSLNRAVGEAFVVLYDETSEPVRHFMADIDELASILGRKMAAEIKEKTRDWALGSCVIKHDRADIGVRLMGKLPLYDDMIPSAMMKASKHWDSGVTMQNVLFADENGAPEYQSVWYVPLNKAMKDSVLFKGVPMMSINDAFDVDNVKNREQSAREREEMMNDRREFYKILLGENYEDVKPDSEEPAFASIPVGSDVENVPPGFEEYGKALTFVPTEKSRRAVRDKTFRHSDALYMKLLDDLWGLRIVQEECRKYMGDNYVADEYAPYFISRNSRGFHRQAEFAILQFQRQLSRIHENDADRFREYMIALRAKEFVKNGVKHGTGWTLKQIDARIAEGNAKPTWVEVKDNLHAIYQAEMADTLVRQGVVSAEQYKVMRDKWPYYVPYLRDVPSDSDIVKFATGEYHKIASLVNPLKKVKGTDEVIPFLDPLAVMVQNITTFRWMAARQRVAQSLVQISKVSDEFGEYAQPVEKPSDAENGAMYFSMFVDGEKRYFQTDPLVYQSLLNLSSSIKMNDFFKAAQMVSDAFKAGTVRYNIAFLFRNLQRDAFEVSRNSRMWWSLPYMHTIFGLWLYNRHDIMNKIKVDNEAVSPIQKLFYRVDSQTVDTVAEAGEHGIFNAALSESANQTADKIVKKAFGESSLTAMEKAAKMAKHPFKTAGKAIAFLPAKFINGLGNLNARIEVAPKLAEYHYLKTRKGMPTEQAVTEAREVNLDFQRMGSSIRLPNRVFNPFLNPQMQGVDKMTRSFFSSKERFAQSMFKTLLFITLPTMLVWFMNHDDPEYKEMPQEEKDRYWFLKIPGAGWFKSSKPYEYGVLFASGIERLLDALVDEDPEAFRGFGSALWNSFTPPVMPIIPATWLQISENKVWYFDMPIVPASKSRLPREEQYGPSTSEFAKFLSKAISKTGLTPPSPYHIDFLIRAHTGSLGSGILSTADAMFEALGVRDEHPKKYWNEMPFFRAFFVTPYRRSESVNTFYDIYDDVEKLANSKNEKYRIYGEATGPYKKIFTSARSDLNKIWKRRNEITENQNMSKEAKRKKLDALDIRAVKIAQSALDRWHRWSEKHGE